MTQVKGGLIPRVAAVAFVENSGSDILFKIHIHKGAKCLGSKSFDSGKELRLLENNLVAFDVNTGRLTDLLSGTAVYDRSGDAADSELKTMVWSNSHPATVVVGEFASKTANEMRLTVGKVIQDEAPCTVTAAPVKYPAGLIGQVINGRLLIFNTAKGYRSWNTHKNDWETPWINSNCPPAYTPTGSILLSISPVDARLRITSSKGSVSEKGEFKDKRLLSLQPIDRNYYALLESPPKGGLDAHLHVCQLEGSRLIGIHRISTFAAQLLYCK